MKGIGNAILLPVLATGLVGSGLAAQPHGDSQYFESTVPQTKEARLAEQTADMEAWLRRLVGRFRVEYPALDFLRSGRKPDNSSNRPDSMVDCVSIGAGVGVHCIFYTAQPRADGSAQEAGVLRPGDILRVSQVVQYGLDPNAGRIRMMVATERSVQRMDGVLSGDAVTSLTRCWNSRAAPPCQVLQKITASADEKDIWVSEQPLSIPVVIRHVLRRMSAEQAAEAETFIERPREDGPGNARPGGGGSRKGGSRPR